MSELCGSYQMNRNGFSTDSEVTPPKSDVLVFQGTELSLVSH